MVEAKNLARFYDVLVPPNLNVLKWKLKIQLLKNLPNSIRNQVGSVHLFKRSNGVSHKLGIVPGPYGLLNLVQDQVPKRGPVLGTITFRLTLTIDVGGPTGVS